MTQIASNPSGATSIGSIRSMKKRSILNIITSKYITFFLAWQTYNLRQKPIEIVTTCSWLQFIQLMLIINNIVQLSWIIHIIIMCMGVCLPLVYCTKNLKISPTASESCDSRKVFDSRHQSIKRQQQKIICYIFFEPVNKRELQRICSTFNPFISCFFHFLLKVIQ